MFFQEREQFILRLRLFGLGKDHRRFLTEPLQGFLHFHRFIVRKRKNLADIEQTLRREKVGGAGLEDFFRDRTGIDGRVDDHDISGRVLREESLFQFGPTPYETEPVLAGKENNHRKYSDLITIPFISKYETQNSLSSHMEPKRSLLAPFSIPDSEQA